MCKFAIKKMLKKIWKNYKYYIYSWSYWKHWSGKLFSIKIWHNSFFKKSGFRICQKNININCVSPGFIKTDMTDQINEDFKNNLISKIPSGKLGNGDDVSNCVAFLASDMADYITGETVHVNGGMYMS